MVLQPGDDVWIYLAVLVKSVLISLLRNSRALWARMAQKLAEPPCHMAWLTDKQERQMQLEKQEG